MVLLWWDANSPRLGGNARAAVQDAEHVFVSAASAWEISIKRTSGRWQPTRAPAEAMTLNGFEMMPVSFEHAEAVASLPRQHGDPFDRLIIATAKVEQLTILTSDRAFWRYDVPLLDARR